MITNTPIWQTILAAIRDGAGFLIFLAVVILFVGGYDLVLFARVFS